MYFRKCPYLENFEFVRATDKAGRVRLGRTTIRARFERFEHDVFRLRVTSPQWDPNPSQAGLTPPPRARRGAVTAELDASLALNLTDAAGRALLGAPAGRAFGVSGASSIFMFEHEEGDQFYGMGEKLLGLELSGKLTKFWNTDVFGDFHGKEVFEDRADPLYASMPYLIVKRGNTYVGLLLDNPHATFISTAANVEIGGGQLNLGRPTKKVIQIGAERGASDLYVLVGPSLPELTRKLQRLVGCTPLPPIWALGYHQCRWGYRSADDLLDLDRKFRAHGIPCDGLWLDIDYMDAFKVFTFKRELFPDLRGTLKALEKRGRKVIPIIDPGVKRQKGYEVYDDGRRRDAFCRNPQGGEFIGLVWPGETAFPDFSLPAARAWWAGWVEKFARNGIRGAWIDMNDPSTGAVQNDAMLFNRGRATHDTFHNQYASGMAAATRAGFEAAHPGRRPFVISRSGFTGIGRHSALWTGDNCSNYHYLRLSIPCSLNLALSGVPFNGPDIGGFAGDCTAQLLRDWQKAGFLFPFCRNHSAAGTRRQEPWAFDAMTLKVVSHYIRLRYKLRPYLYNLFVRQSEEGEAILRPLFYDFADTEKWPLGRIDDQFMVGPAVMQAPVVQEKERTREVLLPGDSSWWSAMDARWIRAPRRMKVAPSDMQTPLFVREGQILPMSPGDPANNRYDGSRVEAHVFLRRGRGTARLEYSWDDGDTITYRKGRRSTVVIAATTRGGTLHLETAQPRAGFGQARIKYALYDRFDTVLLNGRERKLRRGSWILCGTRQPVWFVG
jgi:alpha-glucosidase